MIKIPMILYHYTYLNTCLKSIACGVRRELATKIDSRRSFFLFFYLVVQIVVSVG